MKKIYKDMFMDFAYRAAEASVCVRNKVGAIVVLPSGMLSVGLNGTPPGYHTNICELNPDLTNPHVRHAEAACFDKMLEQGVPAKDGILFCTLTPCVDCAKRIVGAKIKKVYYSEKYRCLAGLDYLEEMGVEVEQYNRNQ